MLAAGSGLKVSHQKGGLAVSQAEVPPPFPGLPGDCENWLIILTIQEVFNELYNKHEYGPYKKYMSYCYYCFFKF